MQAHCKSTPSRTINQHITMDNNIQEEHKVPPNATFTSFIRQLSIEMRTYVKQELQKRIPGHTEGQFNNWVAQRSKIPLYLHKEVTEVCRIAFQKHIDNLITGIDHNDYHFNLFNNNTMEANNKTTIFQAMAEKKIRTQKELADQTGISEQTLSRLMNPNKRTAGISWATVKTISDFFEKAPNEFEEFTSFDE